MTSGGDRSGTEIFFKFDPTMCQKRHKNIFQFDVEQHISYFTFSAQNYRNQIGHKSNIGFNFFVNASEDLKLTTSHKTDGKAVTRKEVWPCL